MKLYAYIIYIARRAMVAVGNAKNETWFAFVLVSGFEMYVVIDLIYVASVIWKLNLRGKEAPTALASLLLVGLMNYLIVYRGGAYKRYDEEFSTYSGSRHAVCASATVIAAVGIAVASAYLPSVFHRT